MEVGTDELNDDGKGRPKKNWGLEGVVGVVEERVVVRRDDVTDGGGRRERRKRENEKEAVSVKILHMDRLTPWSQVGES